MLMAVLRCIVSAVLMLTTLFQHRTVTISHTDDEALYLTSMIRAGHVVEARNACKVVGLLSEEAQSFESYSGYLTVDDVHDSNLFFWFFPAANDAADAPVMLWLQGGPGKPSLFGLFEEHGPFSVSKESGTIKLRNHTWVSTHSMLYVDNPVGTGFSFTGDDAGYSKNQTAIGRNMYEALLQFFTVFPEYQKNDFYIAGESYAGKYVPTVSYVIHQKNPVASVKINLKGIAIGNGFIDPINQVAYGETLYQYGVINESEKRKFEELEHIVSNQIKNGNYRAAYYTDLESTDKFYKLTGLASMYNVLANTEEILSGIWRVYVSHPDVREALHVGERQLNDGWQVRTYLLDDEMQSVSPRLGTLLDTGLYRVLLYSGQLDIIVPYSGTVKVARSLRWSGAESFKNATRTIWRVRASEQGITDVAGYVTSFGPLTLLLVRNAGHMVPMDQPAWAHEMITRFTSGKPFQ